MSKSPGVSKAQRLAELREYTADPQNLLKPEFTAAVKELEALKEREACPKPPKGNGKAAARANRGGNGGSARQTGFRYVSDIAMKPIDWFWPKCMPIGLNLIAGDSGKGKSQILCALAATITTGGRWPVSDLACEKGSVIFIQSEDHAEWAFTPRLRAAGADTGLCVLLDSTVEYVDASGSRVHDDFNLAVDLQTLESAMAAIRKEKGYPVKAIMIDPLISYMGRIKAADTVAVRSVLDPLVRFAEAHNIAVVGVAHFNKSAMQDAIYRVSGSNAFYQVPRSVWQVHPDEGNPDRLMLLSAKRSHYGEKCGFGYAFKTVTLEGGIETSRIEWEAAHETRDANDVMRANQKATQEDRGGELREAMRFIAALLAEGPVKAAEVERAFRQEGFSAITIKRAKKTLGVESEKTAKDGWIWVLPKGIMDGKTLPSKTHDPLDPIDPLQQPRGFQPEINGLLGQGDHLISMIALNSTTLQAAAPGNRPEPSHPQPETALNTEI
jgi:putative DNA primase/helicase